MPDMTYADLAGFAMIPDGSTPESAVLEMSISQWDTVGDTVVVGAKRVALVGNQIPPGTKIWRTVEGTRAQKVQMTLYWSYPVGDAIVRRKMFLGAVEVGASPSYDLSELLDSSPSGAPETTHWMSITQTQYDDIMQATTDAAASAVEAALYDGPKFKTVALMRASTTVPVSVGSVWWAGGSRYEVLDPAAVTYDEITTGLTKLKNLTHGFSIGARNMRVVAGALRNVAGVWSFISDSVHEPVGAVSVSVISEIDLRVTFEAPNSKVVSALVGVDESFARMGLIAGASVGVNSMDIRATMPFDFSVATDGANAPIITAPSEYSGQIAATRSGAKIRINHPKILSPPIVSPAVGAPLAYVDTLQDTSFNLIQSAGNMSDYYRVRYISGAWQLLTSNPLASLDTSSFASSGNIVVNLGKTLPGNGFMYQTSSDRHIGSTSRIFSSDATSFTVRFYDPLTSAVLKTATDGVMESTFLYGFPYEQLNTNTTLPVGTYHVSRGRIITKWADLVSPDSYGGNSNIWFIALIEE